MKNEKRVFVALLWIATAALFGAAYTWIQSEWGEPAPSDLSAWDVEERRVMEQRLVEQADLIGALESDKLFQITAMEHVTTEMAALREENERLKEALDAAQGTSAPAGEEPEISDAERQRLEAPLSWLRGLSPEHFGDMTAEALRRLRELDLSELPVTDEDLVHLAQLASLRRLTLRKTAITDAGLEHLQSIAGLEDLSLRETDITDAGMDHLAKISTLTRLDLNTTPVTDAGLARLADMTQLVFLRLNYTGITEAGLAHLRRMTALERLDLWGTEIGTEPGTIGDLPALSHLELGATDVSREWIERFQEEHPDAYVRSRYGR
ncbi:MAG: leucine-rich repeat domain-containing protein [Planctomycetota bacterium]|jgi:hypothetical protein